MVFKIIKETPLFYSEIVSFHFLKRNKFINFKPHYYELFLDTFIIARE